MALPAILNVGQGENDGTGDRRRDAFVKIKACLEDIDGRLGLQEGSTDGLDLGLSSEVTRAIAAEQANATAIAAETTRAQTAEGLLAPKDSPTFTNVPKAPTQPAGDNSKAVATTEYADRSAANAASAAASPPVRQTVLSGPVSAGAPSFLPSTASGLVITSQGVSASVPLILTAARGFNAAGALNTSTALTSNPTWSGLAASATNYLFINAATGATYSSTLAPIYQFGGAPSTASGQFTFDWQSMVGYLGNGTAAVATPLVAVGEAVTSSTAVTSTTAYAYSGAYDSGWTAGLPTSIVSRSHNLGVQPLARRMIAENTTAENGFAVGDQITSDGGIMAAQSSFVSPIAIPTTRLSATPVQGASGWASINKSSAASAALTPANWRWKIVAQRGW